MARAKSAEDLTAATSKHPLSKRRDVTMPSRRLRTTRNIPGLSRPNPMSPELSHSDGAVDQPAVIKGAINSGSGSRLPAAAKREAMPDTKSVPGNEWDWNLQNAADPSACPPNASDSDASSSRESQFMSEAGRSSPAISSLPQEDPVQSKTKTNEEDSGFTSNLQFIQDSDSSAPQGIWNRDPLSNENALRSDSANTAGMLNYASPERSGKGDTKIDIALTADAPQEAQNNAHPFIEEMNPQDKLKGTPMDAFGFQTGLSEMSKASVLQSGSIDASQKVDLAGKLEISQNSNARLGNAPAAVPISNTRNIGHGSLEEKPPQGQLGGAQPITFSSQTEFPQSSNGTALQSAGIDASQMVDAADNLEISKNADRVEDLPTDISAGKTQDMAEVAFESMAFGEYGADQNESHNAPIPGIAPQNRPENSLQSSGAIPTTAAENPQEGLSAFILPSVVRAGNSGSFMKAASEPVATAQPQSFILQMAQRIQFQIREGKETIRIQLKPDSLGRVEIRAETTGNGVIARIATESNSVRSYLENNMHVLQQTLQDQGLKVDRIYFVVQDGLSFSANTGYSAQFGHAGTGHPGGESHSSHGMSGSLTSDLAEEKPLDATTWVSLNPNIRFHTIA